MIFSSVWNGTGTAPNRWSTSSTWKPERQRTESKLGPSTPPTISTPTRSLRTSLKLLWLTLLFPLGNDWQRSYFLLSWINRYALKNFTDKDIMLNTEDTGSMENLFEIRRYQIDIQNERVSKANIIVRFLKTGPEVTYFRPFPPLGRTMLQMHNLITTSLTSQKSTPTTTEGKVLWFLLLSC